MSETVNQALRRGTYIVLLPSLVFTLGGLFFVSYLIDYSKTPVVLNALIIFSPFVLGLLYYCATITKWQIWAFSNVRNVHELRQKAENRGLITQKDEFIARFIIVTQSQKAKLVSLEDKFKIPDEFKDDTTVPNETKIYYSINLIIVKLMVDCVAVCLGLYSIFHSEYELVVICFGFSVAIIALNWKSFTDKRPQVILSSEGMQTISTSFYNWNDINDEKVIKESSGKTTIFYLAYNCPAGNEKFEINKLEASWREVEQLLTLYRARSNQLAKS